MIVYEVTIFNDLIWAGAKDQEQWRIHSDLAYRMMWVKHLIYLDMMFDSYMPTP